MCTLWAVVSAGQITEKNKVQDFGLDSRAGEVLRMPMDRLPRKLLTAWLPHKRAVGATLNWGRTLKKALEFNNLPTTSHFNHLFTLANQTVPKVRNNPDPASWLQSTKPK